MGTFAVTEIRHARDSHWCDGCARWFDEVPYTRTFIVERQTGMVSTVKECDDCRPTR